MVDIHCHLFDSKYEDTSTPEMVNRAREKGIKLIANGAGMRENYQIVDLAEKQENLWVCIGMAYEIRKTSLVVIKKQLKNLAGSKKVIGIGEAGLNYYNGISENLKQWQRELFRMHLELAAELNLPIQIHNRGANLEILDMVKEYGVRGVLHCFSGDENFLNQALKSGLYISLGGLVTFKNSRELRNLVTQIPDDRLLLETDSPYLSPEPIRGRINFPWNIILIARAVANLKSIPLDKLEHDTDENTGKLFVKMG